MVQSGYIFSFYAKKIEIGLDLVNHVVMYDAYNGENLMAKSFARLTFDAAFNTFSALSVAYVSTFFGGDFNTTFYVSLFMLTVTTPLTK